MLKKVTLKDLDLIDSIEKHVFLVKRQQVRIL